MLNVNQTFYQSSIGRRLIVNVILFSTLITLMITAIQLYRDYKTDMALIENQLRQVEVAHLPSLSAMLWASDKKELETHVEGILQLRDIRYLEVRDEEQVWVSMGDRSDSKVISRQYHMHFNHRGRDLEIGTLTVVASLSGVYQRLLDKIWTILVSNGIKTFLVAMFMLVLFHKQVTRHLHRIAEFSTGLDVDRFNRTLILDRSDNNATKNDELDVLVTAINQMQARLKSSVNELQDSEQHYRSLVESSSAIPWEVDIDSFRFTYVGPQAVAILGYPVEEWYQENFFAEKLHPEGREETLAYCKSEADLGRDHEFEYSMIAADGSVVWLRDSVNLVFENGVAVRMQGYMFDITARKAAEEALQHAYDDLEEKIRSRTTELQSAKDDAEHATSAKSEFLSRMSHELRTPLHAMIGYGQLLEQEQMPENQAEYLDEMMRASKHLLVVIDEVLDLSRIEAGQMKMHIDEFEIMPLIKDCIDLVHPLTKERGLTVTIEPGECGKDVVVADIDRMKEVLINLLSNAVKYNSENGQILLGCKRGERGALRIEVTDTGNGLTQEQQDIMFEPFTRLGRENSDIKGTGIGLTICRKLVEAMDGRMGVEGQEGKGCTFWVELPVSDLVTV